ncbi:MAG: methyltransferase domain-containing protein [gamma proteobacterium symbiont of Bathyaustriella thionipta]|nr:methyltransferase domain-containing protein [gamma proteobacterium symbiont of Bathyaustriella thionipta]MCU7948738.1 methyltransferase domain-containing protein [gamma proteobacterium symbiont of Bathyaustriella thionipta]MCU7953566.1 methyltransferase domain-containing protein [gamma proteobacterium symbiont of Bathyaustriella thionipta]MCU7955221.1 methyltransferase domain-containing protein [gamma proteobacterium symbiont of Bathyaustriella thionipta]MCU7966051.1 methyltransferase domain
MKEIRAKWNNRYEAVHVPNQVIDVLELNQHLLPAYGKSLDLACGLGGNALRMAELGFESHAWDISDSAIEKIQEFAQERQLNLSTRQCDISQHEQQDKMLAEGFDVIIVSRFLLREIMPCLISSLRPGGLIFYQTFVQGQQDNDKTSAEEGPRNAHFRLESNELVKLFPGLTLRYYREEGRQGDLGKGFRNEAMLVAQKNY